LLIICSDLTPEAHILYSSDSVIDILGYTPDEIVNRSAWDFFDKNELPYAQEFHQRKVVMDKAAVLAYCDVLSKDGQWIGCECCFTIVYDVMIVCTSIYKRGGKSESKLREHRSKPRQR
jgi:PAS domain S-box-containing protein